MARGNCKLGRIPKSKPYGGKRALHWCDGCDAELVPPQPKKSRERHAARREIANGPHEPEYDDQEWTPPIPELEDESNDR